MIYSIWSSMQASWDAIEKIQFETRITFAFRVKNDK